MAKNKSLLIDQKLLLAYQQAGYEVFEPPIFLYIGHPSPLLDTLLRQHDYTAAAFITAYNPRSNLLSLPQNQERHQQLLQIAQQKQWTYLPGQSTDPQAQWPAEQALLILGIKEEMAQELGEYFEQNAVVYYPLNGIASLLWCR